MNRVIKFRVYDKTNDKMFYSNYYHIELDLRYETVLINDCIFDYEDEIEAILTQYTGLKDKNDKEIYEGDIVRVYGGEYCQGYYEYDSKCVVKWRTCGFDMITIKEGYGIGWGFCDDSEYIEVIGNIYENPELLKE